ncbi:LysE family translocator [Roseovarius sp. E0-M6]|uniref:LysE family translocator n=1 Tax=Roseovarius sp. E0-M6 TaxID=3127118 RepID=UPI0030104565
MTDFLPFLPGFLAAYAILVVAASSPGPAVAMLLGIAMGQGRAPALVAGMGIATGSVVLNLGTLAGVGLILTQAAWAMAVLRVIGGAYLLWLAWGAFRKAVHPPRIDAAPVAQRSMWRHFLKGFALQVTNPKAIVFWLAIASVGATAGGGPGVVALFVAGAFAISFGCHGAWALVLSSGPIRRAYGAARRWIEAALGAFFTLAAVKLATSGES